MRKFKKSWVLAALLMGNAHLSLADLPSFQVVDWNSSASKFELKTVLQDQLELISSEQFASKNFSIYRRLEDQTFSIRVAKPQDLDTLRAATLAYQLKKIENFFSVRLTEISSSPDLLDFSFSPKKIRFDVPYLFSPKSFYDSERSLENTSLTIPPADPQVAQEGWSDEIWFAREHATRILYRYSSDRVMDTALCPDAIYHEYTHLLTGQFMGRNRIMRTLTEGLSDYFAASFLNHSNLYTSDTCPYVKKQLLVRPFRVGKLKGKYSLKMEDSLTQLKFLPSLLWKYRAWVGADIADRTILRAVTRSTPATRIYPEFVQQLSDALSETAGESMAQTLESTIYRPAGLMSSRGESQSVFAWLPKTQSILPNVNPESKTFCQSENHFEFDWHRVQRARGVLYARWKCDGLTLPIKFDFSGHPERFFSSNFLRSGLDGKMSFTSPAVRNPNPNLSPENTLKYQKMVQLIETQLFAGNGTRPRKVTLLPPRPRSQQSAVSIRLRLTEFPWSSVRVRF